MAGPPEEAMPGRGVPDTAGAPEPAPAWPRFFPAGEASPLETLPPPDRRQARDAAAEILRVHRAYLAEFRALTAQARETFENRAWIQGALDAGRRIGLYREAVDAAWRTLRGQPGAALADRGFWLGVREAYLESICRDYDADLALTLFYSVMRLAFDGLDVPVEYADDGLTRRCAR
jgi:hypothetical protein